MNRILLALLGALAIATLGCKSSQEKKSEDNAEMQKPAEPGPGVPPGHCRIIGTVVSIDPSLSTMTDDPCAKAPCVATVKVDEIVGYGSGFVGNLGKGSEVKVRFQYTLTPTSEMFPAMSPPLPGLDTGSKFQADVRMNNALMGSDQVTYVVDRYQVLE
ncbi:MAG: hypothetical protein WEB33_10200 [Bacteroidota bacterium]